MNKLCLPKARTYLNSLTKKIFSSLYSFSINVEWDDKTALENFTIPSLHLNLASTFWKQQSYPYKTVLVFISVFVCIPKYILANYRTDMGFL